jgi:guanylate cyclase
MHATLQVYAITLAVFAYGTGVALGMGWLAFEGCAVVALLLFGRRATLIAAATFMVLTFALGMAGERGWLPDSTRIMATALSQPTTSLWSGPVRLSVYSLILVGVVLAMSMYTHALLERERARSERLLLNVLPAAVAERLKRGDTNIADGFDAVTVLFADLVGFTALSEKLPPQELVALLNRVFSAFDEISDRFGLEKIKTIGDAYMLVGGVPDSRPDHARTVAEAALEIRAAVERIGGGALAIRIGIHTGPVVAGVIGKRKYAYDLWGDTVNLASRMESHGVVGGIQVTERTQKVLVEDFELEERGPVDVKGKGAIRTFLLKGRRRPGA